MVGRESDSSSDFEFRRFFRRVCIRVLRQRRRFLQNLDEERISSFQTFYYWMIVLAGLYIWLVAEEPTRALLDTLGPGVYEGWVVLNLVCPLMTLIGRKLYNKSADIGEGKPNPAYGAALLQLWGDAGVWSAILIYAGCFFTTFYWGEPLYATFFFLMGIPGGFRFTWRSWRRIRQIHRTERRLR